MRGPATRIILVFLSLAGIVEAADSRRGAGLAARFVGQDGHDLVGEWKGLKPSDVQDIHIVITGLPAGRSIAMLHTRAEGGDEWIFQGPQGTWGCTVVPDAATGSAHLYLEPRRVEKGRDYALFLRLDDGSNHELRVRAGKVDPNLRMPGAALVVKWLGQERHDWVGPTLAVGPDGVQDCRLALSGLSTRFKIVAADLEGPGGRHWHHGVNPKGHPNAELMPNPNDPSQADFYFQPDRDLTGQKLRLTLTYEHGKTDSAVVTASRADAQLKMARAALPVVVPSAVRAEWLGQDGSKVTGPGDVHVRLTNLPAGRTPSAAVLSDSVRKTWVYKQDDRAALDTEPEPLPLAVQRGAAGAVDLFFPPYRDETGATLTLRLVYPDGALALASFPGGACAPERRAPEPAATSVVARPGADLHDLVNRFGTVRLAPGDYLLNRPLVLSQPVAVVGEPGAVLRFAQGAGDAPWATAIKIHRGGTTLRGFALRFAGPVRWNPNVSWGPGLIGLTDNLDPPDPGRTGPKLNLTFADLDIEAPPSANPAGKEPAPRLLKLIGAQGGTIAGNVLRGGTIELFDGPWRIENNTYRGTPPGTVCAGFLGAHHPHDLLVRNNRARPVAPQGKTWRFLVLVNSGYGDRIENNTIEALGERDDDTIARDNQPEIILTESYRLKFEGKPAAVATDRRIVHISQHRGQAGTTGDVVAVLSGPSAGQWRRIAQALEPTTYLLDAPLPEGAGAIAIASGFVHETFAGNRVDSRGSSTVGNLVLAGNHFGTVVRNNHFLGGGHGFSLSAFPTESPGMFGWSHVPFLGGVIEGNVIEDAARGAKLEVQHTPHIKANAGRVYMAVTLRDNVVRWTPEFLARRPGSGAKGLPPGLTVGAPGGLDPEELVVEARGNRLQAPSTPGRSPAGTLRVHGALYNGKKLVDQTSALPVEDAEAQVGRRN